MCYTIPKIRFRKLCRVLSKPTSTTVEVTVFYHSWVTKRLETGTNRGENTQHNGDVRRRHFIFQAHQQYAITYFNNILNQ